MPAELMLNFPDPTQVAVYIDISDDGYKDMTSAFAFVNPLTENDMEEIRWYLEDYGTGYRAEPDDERADRVREQLPGWGTALFKSVFKADDKVTDKAYELFRNFRDEEEKGRLLTIAADHPAVLSLPWELIRPVSGVFLFGETPRISIRRRLPMAGEGRMPHKRKPKSVLRLLFIVSRPEDAGFINPRTDPQAVLDALEQQKQRRVEVEFLRPATLTALQERLRDEDQPAIDIIHFDGHGVFDRSGSIRGPTFRDRIWGSLQNFLKEAGSRNEFSTNSGQGYLLFEDDQGKKALVEAHFLGELFFRQHIGLVVLSACQSAAMDEDDAMSSVAGRLVHTGIPTVIAMSYNVLAATTKQLFAQFYRSLFQGRTVSRSLDDARYFLFVNPERGIRLRGEGGAQEVTLELDDWFLPILYQQSGADKPLLKAGDSLPPKPEPLHNLPQVQESGFFGRSRELWQIEQAFAVEGCRRFSITGFGGQGKTALALEAGYWLLRTGLFQRVCFVSFAGFQGIDPVGVTISTLATVLDESLLDAEAAEVALKRIPTLLMLDNLETLADGAGLSELLTAASRWSEAGDSRILLTSRQPDFNHPDYPPAGSFLHQCLHLKGLGEQDALDWFGELMRLPPEPKFGMPKRSALVNLFQQVDFHPLSIGLLAQQLKECRPAELGERLETLLEEQPADWEDRSLLASLELSLERLPERCREWLPRLGVFQGGGLEEIVVKVAGLEDYPSEWSIMLYRLELSELMQAERVSEINKNWLRFHPNLAPALWQRIGKEEQARLLERYCQAYHHLSVELYRLDNTTPQAARAIAQYELPNLLRAVHASLQTGNTEEGVNFADNVNRFLRVFGMQREHQALTEAAAKAGGAIGSQVWFSARFNLGRQLQESGQTAAAEQVFQDILIGFEGKFNYQRCMALHMLGRCREVQGQVAAAEQLFRQTLAELARLEQGQKVRREIGSAQTDLADVLREQGRYREASETYQVSLEIYQELDDARGRAVVTGQLGTLAYLQDELVEAMERWQEALALWQNLNEPISEAVAWHQLGLVYQQAKHWEAAEQAYRQASRLKEKLGLLGGSNGAGASWQQLAQVCFYTNRVEEAEQWYRKALAARRAADDRSGIALTLNNLASLIAKDTDRLDEARHLTEEALAIGLTLDPAAAEVWTTYSILADIASQRGDKSQAAVYRAKSREGYLAFSAWRQQLRQHEELIAAVVQGNGMEAALSRYGEAWANLKAAIQRILSGQRDEASLFEPLNYKEAAVIRAILTNLANELMDVHHSNSSTER